MAFHGLLGRKVGMTQVFTDEGNAVGVTVLEMGPNPITQVRSEEVDGYCAVQVAYGSRKVKNLSKPVRGHLAKTELESAALLREFRVPSAEIDAYEAGSAITVAALEGVSLVDVTATSKGRGFTGVMKRHNMSGAATMTHGTHEAFRHGGSIGACAYPGRVWKGQRMAGQMGSKRVTIQNVEIVRVDTERNLVLVRGGVAGPRNGIVMLRPAVKK
jgi:large subunit ribosomal protein L3